MELVFRGEYAVRCAAGADGWRLDVQRLQGAASHGARAAGGLHENVVQLLSESREVPWV